MISHINLVHKRQRIMVFVLYLFFILAAQQPYAQEQEAERVSAFGEYKGYSEEIYDSWGRTSRYLTMRDGTRIAIDIIRPKKNADLHQEPLPVVFSHNRYRRAHYQNGKLITSADSPFIQPLLKHGYIIANADVRGSGASFGIWKGIWTQKESQDAYEVIQWLASQPWCDGNVGMVGGSYLGVTQLMAAGTRPPHLKCIFPAVAVFDLYGICYPGGIFYDDYIRTWSELTRLLDTQATAAPVEGDTEEAQLKAAVQQHKQNRLLIDIFLPLKYRDSVDEHTGVKPFYRWHPAAYVEEINESGIPMYLWGGWFDSFTRDSLLMYRNFDNPKKMAMGAWPHSPRDSEIAEKEFSLMATEALRWNDYWLKGIQNGIMEEPPIRYHLMKAPQENEWQTAEQWPLPKTRTTRYYFHQGPSGSVNSANDGILNKDTPSGQSGQDEYEVDYSTTTGTETRWDNAVGGGFDYPDMTANDEKGLTYTTDPLTADVEITGHPVVHMWISSTASDGDFFAYLEEVDVEGTSHYVTEGALRGSHRPLNEPYYDKMGLPFHRSHQEDMAELIPGEPVEMAFDLQPTSNLFDFGNRIRVTITCADKDNALSPQLTPPPTVTVYRNSEKASSIDLPVIVSEVEAEAEQELSFFTIFVISMGIIILVIVFSIFVRKRLKK